MEAVTFCCRHGRATRESAQNQAARRSGGRGAAGAGRLWFGGKAAGRVRGTTSTAGLGTCSANCGPDTDAFFDNTRIASLKLTFEDADLAVQGYAPDQWLDLLWAKWNNHCGPYEWLPVRMKYESPDGVGNDVLTRSPFACGVEEQVEVEPRDGDVGWEPTGGLQARLHQTAARRRGAPLRRSEQGEPSVQ